MNKVYTSQEFIKRLKWLAEQVPNKYHSGKGWSELHDGKWWFDCVVSVKCILWGFKADKNLFRGGTKYCSNGVPDFTCNGALNYCTDVSTDFSHLEPGEYLCMKGVKDSSGKELNHTGIYLGNGKVFECTSSRAWGVSKCVISDIDSKGIRSRNGIKNYRWSYHGKLNYIDYPTKPQPVNQVKLWQAYMNEQWNCGLVIDGSFGPLCEKAATKHQLYKWVKAPIMVKWLQNRLIDLGYSCGKAGIDGSFGNDTDKAIRQFQKDKGLKVDGYVGKDTYRALVK